MSDAPRAVTMEKIVSLSKRRGFVFPGSEIYGGLANAWDYGPMGVELKRNVKEAWWRDVVRRREDVVGLDAAIMMNPAVWEASGHLAGFTDPPRRVPRVPSPLSRGPRRVVRVPGLRRYAR